MSEIMLQQQILNPLRLPFRHLGILS